MRTLLIGSPRIVGSICQEENNWESAAKYYAQALESPSADDFPEIHFDLAWCLGKLKRLKEEEMHLRRCLDLDPDFPYALNNLGWSFYKQGKYETALNTFEDAIERGNDGKYPLRNRARALSKLGRFPDAIQAWRSVQDEGKPLAYVEREIAQLTKRIYKQTAV